MRQTRWPMQTPSKLGCFLLNDSSTACTCERAVSYDMKTYVVCRLGLAGQHQTVACFAETATEIYHNDARPKDIHTHLEVLEVQLHGHGTVRNGVVCDTLRPDVIIAQQWRHACTHRGRPQHHLGLVLEREEAIYGPGHVKQDAIMTSNSC